MYLGGGECGYRLSPWKEEHVRKESRVEEMEADKRTHNLKVEGASRECATHKDTEEQGRRGVRKVNKT